MTPRLPTDVAVLDVGSNSVRFVLYRRTAGVWQPVFNEKASCGLGRTLGKTGALDRDGKRCALKALRRFTLLAKDLGAQEVIALATAAIRESSDGAAFADEIRHHFSLNLRVLSGAEEGHYGGLGVLAFAPEAKGLCGDQGGASLELTVLHEGHLGATISLPLGVLPLLGVGQKHIRDKLKQAPQGTHKVFYAVGGTWRALATMHQKLSGYPLEHIHYYTVTPEAVQVCLAQMQGLNPAAIAKLPGVPKSRAETLPVAAMVLAEICARFKIENIVFSGNGIREGYLHHHYPVRGNSDPLLDEAMAYASVSRLFADTSEALFEWLTPVRALVMGRLDRMVRVLCLIADSARKEHPDHRAELAYTKILYVPFTAITHRERAFLALAMFIRHAGKIDRRHCSIALALLSQQEVADAQLMGSALRLAKALAGGQDDLLTLAPLSERHGWSLTFTNPDRLAPGELPDKRLEEFRGAVKGWRKVSGE